MKRKNSIIIKIKTTAEKSLLRQQTKVTEKQQSLLSLNDCNSSTTRLTRESMFDNFKSRTSHCIYQKQSLIGSPASIKRFSISRSPDLNKQYFGSGQKMLSQNIIPNNETLFNTQVKGHRKFSFRQFDVQSKNENCEEVLQIRFQELKIIEKLKGSKVRSVEEIVQKQREKINSPNSLNSPIRSYVDKPVMSEFRDYIKHSDRYQQQQYMLQIEENIYSKMSNKIQNDQLAPRNMRLFDRIDQKLESNNQLSSDDYANLFSIGLGNLSNVKQLELKNNKLDDLRAPQIISQIPKSLIQLDLSNNHIGKDGLLSLCQLITQKEYRLKVLILENNKLKDIQVISLFDCLKQNKTIHVLNLSCNLISDYSMPQLSQFLGKSQTLEELYLHYNIISCLGGITLFKGLLKNKYLRVIDISFNRLGGNQECSQAICQTLMKPNSNLLHIDISYNGFDNDDAYQLSLSLAQNHHIFGFHLQEMNIDFVVDSQGFLVNQSDHKIQSKQYTKAFISSKIISKFNEYYQQSDPKTFKRINSVNCNNNFTKDNCWICQGWCEIKFQWRPNFNYQSQVYLHLDFEGYQPMQMENEVEQYTLHRMCPPNSSVKYFFSDPSNNLQFITEDQHSTKLNNLYIGGLKMIQIDGTIIQSQLMINEITTTQNNKLIDAQKHYLPTVKSIPRIQCLQKGYL